MEIVITKTFAKQYERSPAHVKESVKRVITALDNAKSLKEIKDIKKLSGFEFYYRVRIGQYRIGLKEQTPKVFLFCVLERSQIYKIFPLK